MTFFRQDAHYSRGFTIVELGIVIAVIGILAAISIVGYGNWRERTEGNAVQSDLKQAAAAMESARNFGNTYPASLPSSFTPSSGVELSYGFGSSTTYCINGHSKAMTSVEYYIEAGGEPKKGQCTAPTPTVGAPVIASVNVTGSQAVVSWGVVSSATGYDIRWRVLPAGSWNTVTSTGLSTTINGLSAGSRYEYQVSAKSGSGSSAWSSSVERVVVPTPTINSVTMLACGNNGNSDAWVDGAVSWSVTSSSITASYRLEGDSGEEYGTVPSTTTNPGSGSLMVTGSSTRWPANVSGAGTFYLYGIGPNGERSNAASWTTGTYPPYEC